LQWESNSLTNVRYGRLNLVDLAGSERSLSSALDAAPFQALICSIQGLLALLASVASCFSLSFFLVWILQSSVGWVVLKKCSFIVPSLYYVSNIAAEICDSFATRSQLDMGFLLSGKEPQVQKGTA
jgi:hypothetical protein